MNTRTMRRVRPSLEALETRLAPATRVWDGGGVTNNWSDRFNWDADVAPANNDDLVFPDRSAVSVDPTSLNNSNNISGLTASSITFNDSGYTITVNALQLSAGGITFNDASIPDFSTVGLGLNVSTLRNCTVIQGSTDALRISGPISGAGGIIKDGAGSLRLSGNNTFTGQ